MPNRVAALLHISGGNAGTQGDFLDECWQSASPGHSGTHGNAGTQADAAHSCVPERSQVDQERSLPETTGQMGVCSRVPEECDQQQEATAVLTFMTDWAAAARQLTGQFKDLEARRQLYTLFYRRTQYLRADRGLDRDAAEREAYGWLLTRILNLTLEMQLRATDATP